jgi:hypothetical protein
VTNINDMGLRGQREWFGPSYRNEMEARQWNMADWHEHFRLHRKMTAADLGLPPLLVDQFGRRWHAFGDEGWFEGPEADWLDVIAGNA